MLVGWPASLAWVVCISLITWELQNGGMGIKK
jgi:hypothetical protein